MQIVCVLSLFLGCLNLFKKLLEEKKQLSQHIIRGQVLHFPTLLAFSLPPADLELLSYFFGQKLVLLSSFPGEELLCFSQAAPRSGAFKGFLILEGHLTSPCFSSADVSYKPHISLMFFRATNYCSNLVFMFWFCAHFFFFPFP